MAAVVKVNEHHSMQSVHGPQSSLSSDGSFVVLERSTAEAPSNQFRSISIERPLSLPSSAVGVHTSSPSSNVTGSLTSNLSPEEIQKRLQDLLHENVQLKETLHQNNLAMKQQFSTLVKWQEEVVKVHQCHKEKFAETRALVLKLKQENSELKRYLEESNKSVTGATPNLRESQLKAENLDLRSRVAELEQKVAERVVPSEKERELATLLEQEHIRLEGAERARRQLVVDAERLAAQRARAEREVAELRSRLQSVEEELQRTQRQDSYVMVENQMYLGSLPTLPLQPSSSLRGSDSLRGQLAEEQQHVAELTTQLLEERGRTADLACQIAEEQAHGASLTKRLGEQANQVATLITQLDKERTHVASLEAQLEAEKAHVAALTRKSEESRSKVQVNPVQTTSTSTQPKRDDKSALQQSIGGYEDKLQEMNRSLIRESESYSSLESWLQVVSKNVVDLSGRSPSDIKTIQLLKVNLDEVKLLLVKEKSSNEEKKEKLMEAQKEFQKLFADYQALLQEWELYSQDQQDKARHNSAYLEVQAQGFTEKIDKLTAEVLAKDETVTQKTQEIDALRSRMKQLELENEAVELLKAQVEVYQLDFNAERESREHLAGEKERLSEDLRHLQLRNEQLIDEVDKLQRNQFEVIERQTPGARLGSGYSTIAAPGRSQGYTSSRQSPPRATSEERQHPPLARMYDEEVPPPKQYFCPKCAVAFKTLEPLQYHVETCLELTN